MYPPADPWADATPPEPHPTPTVPVPTYGRASVPVPPPALRESTEEFPPVVGGLARPPRTSRSVSWQRTSRASRRSLSDGWGFTATGLIVAFSGWGVWAAALRGTGTSAMSGLIFMLVVAAGLFTLARFFGYLVIEQILRRSRLHARWAHFITGLFLTVAGVSYLVNTTWLADAGDWFRDGFDWVKDVWNAG
jgi:hypothetical protein